MAEIKVFNGQGQAAGTLAAPEKLVSANSAVTLVHQVAVAELAGRRQGNASTLRRDEVAGSGVKIRRQKGTGRSRQGDKRVPHMRGGGVVHGPKPRDYSQNTPKKMKRAAFATALNSRLQNDRIYVLDGVQFDTPKTKNFVSLLGTLDLSAKKVLFLAGVEESNIALSARNLPKVQVQSVNQTSLVDVLKCDVILCTRGAWEEMAARVGGNAEDNQNDSEVAA